VPIESEPTPDEPIEVASEKVREVERARPRTVFLLEGLAPQEEFVAMGAVEPLDLQAFEDRVERAAGAAIAIGHED
jgi:hypothetical protein